MAARTALVTGAYGFVGRNVARRLAAEGVWVRGIGHGSWSREEWRRWGIAEWHNADVTLDSLLTYAGEPEWIFHCAGSGSVAFSMTHPLQDYQRSVTTTLSLLEFMRAHHQGARLVIPSSAGVYGLVREMPIGTATPLAPLSPYGVHKRLAEELALSYGRYFGIRVALVRLFSVYGLGLRKQLLWDACSKLSRGEASFAGTGDETRDWIHVSDAAELMLVAAAHASPDCPIVNGGTGAAVSIREVTEAIADSLDNGVRPRFSGQVRAGDPSHYVADIAEAKAWGWQPREAWRSAVRDYVRWFLAGAP